MRTGLRFHLLCSSSVHRLLTVEIASVGHDFSKLPQSFESVRHLPERAKCKLERRERDGSGRRKSEIWRFLPSKGGRCGMCKPQWLTFVVIFVARGVKGKENGRKG
jgi:hypothetical protein